MSKEMYSYEFQISSSKGGKLTRSDDELPLQKEPVAKTSSSEDSAGDTLNENCLGHQSGGANNKKASDKFLKNRSPIQCLSPVQLQPVESKKVEDEQQLPTLAPQKSLESKRLLQRTFRVDMNDPEQPLIMDDFLEMDTIQKASEDKNASTSSSPVPGVVLTGLRSRTPQVNSGWLWSTTANSAAALWTNLELLVSFSVFDQNCRRDMLIIRRLKIISRAAA